MTDITILPLGAGQDVGRSCILLGIGGKKIMLDCGMHMGFNDERRFPDFKYISEEGALTKHLDCVIISHFHLDHCGALPYMSEMVGYEGPIYMTHPTKAICPILLEDYRKVAVERKGDTNFFTSDMVRACMRKTIGVALHQVVQVDNELKIKAYYAGHVLGAAMFHISVGSQSVVYTGDFNMTPDRHLGAAKIDKCQPDVLISESTYATTIRDSKRCRERDFLKKVLDTIEKGGKVLIPVFALGRAQELCILLETFWSHKDLSTPVYFSLGLTNKATNFYKLFVTWTNESIMDTFVEHNMFHFRHITAFDKKLIDSPDPMVVFATPGMLHGGLSLQIFKAWCSNEKNTIIMPGYCVAGTFGWKILNGHKKLEFENRQSVDVKMAVSYMSFSAHADAKGIMQLIRTCQPRHVLFVHGEAAKMKALSNKISASSGITCHTPANGEEVTIATSFDLVVDVSTSLLSCKQQRDVIGGVKVKKQAVISGVMVVEDETMRLMTAEEAEAEVGMKQHLVRMSINLFLSPPLVSSLITMTTATPLDCLSPHHASHTTLQLLCRHIDGTFPDMRYSLLKDMTVRVSESIIIKTIPPLPLPHKDLTHEDNPSTNKDNPPTHQDNPHHINISWLLQDDELAEMMVDSLHGLTPS